MGKRKIRGAKLKEIIARHAQENFNIASGLRVSFIAPSRGSDGDVDESRKYDDRNVLMRASYKEHGAKSGKNGDTDMGLSLGYLKEIVSKAEGISVSDLEPIVFRKRFGKGKSEFWASGFDGFEVG